MIPRGIASARSAGLIVRVVAGGRARGRSASRGRLGARELHIREHDDVIARRCGDDADVPGALARRPEPGAGPNARITSIALRLGVLWYAYDTVTFKGEVTAVEDGVVTVKVVGSNSLGDHVVATATLTMGAP